MSGEPPAMEEGTTFWREFFFPILARVFFTRAHSNPNV